ncbi:hypothetical protein L9F63_005252, partial [Diploptera punctata]
TTAEKQSELLDNHHSDAIIPYLCSQVNVLQTEYNNLKSDLSLIDLQQQLKVLKEKWKLTENVLRKLARRNSNDQRKKIKKLRLSLTNKLRVYLKCDKSTQIWSYSNK